MVKSKVTDFHHKTYCASARMKSSLKFLSPEFLPISCGPHPIWLTCGISRSAIKAAKVQAIIISGRYRDFKLMAKFNNDSENCKLPGCESLVGDIKNLLSGDCPALKDALLATLSHSLLLLQSSSPLLVPPVLSAMERSSFEFVRFILNTSVDEEAVKLKQLFGTEFIWPLFRLSRAYVWCMHRGKRRFMKINSDQQNQSSPELPNV